MYTMMEGTLPQKFHCLPVTLILIVIRGRGTYRRRWLQVAGEPRLEQGTRQNFLSSQKKSVRFAAEESNPTINYRLY